MIRDEVRTPSSNMRVEDAMVRVRLQTGDDPVRDTSLEARCPACGVEEWLDRMARRDEAERTEYLCHECGAVVVAVDPDQPTGMLLGDIRVDAPAGMKLHLHAPIEDPSTD